MSDRLTLQELTDAAGVSVRTVRYYITEGLLPPALGAGSSSFYVPAHLNRLRLIGRLKDGYLPLKEIRRRLSGVDDATVDRLLTLDDTELLTPATWANLGGVRAVREDAAAYAERPPTKRAEAPVIAFARARRPPAPGGMPEAEPWFADDERFYERVDLGFDEFGDADAGVAELDDTPRNASLSRLTSRPEEGQAVRRFALGEGAELTIPEALLRHRREQVEWLLRWARKVLR
ncbi:MAG: MerR family transcriptional regulator [Thermomicrobiales bacterium]|nr:MerR family transcriptional regulator [Thermomicrobiales bacterium]